MIESKKYISGFWKANLALLLSLFVFVSYNNNVCANVQETVKTELLVSNDQCDSDILFLFELPTDHVASILPKFFFERLHKSQINLDCVQSALVVKTQLTLFIDFRSHINSTWITFRQSIYNDEADIVVA